MNMAIFADLSLFCILASGKFHYLGTLLSFWSTGKPFQWIFMVVYTIKTHFMPSLKFSHLFWCIGAPYNYPGALASAVIYIFYQKPINWLVDAGVVKSQWYARKKTDDIMKMPGNRKYFGVGASFFWHNVCCI